MKTRDLLNMLDAEIQRAAERLQEAVEMEDYEEALKQDHFARAFLRIQLWASAQTGRKR